MANERFRNMYPHIHTVKDFIDKNNKLIIFDTETTGLAEDAHIIQFSAILYDIVHEYDVNTGCPYIRLVSTDYMDTFINPNTILDPVITKLTGITDEMLKDAPKENEIASKIIDFMNQSPLWAAYNMNFDLTKLLHMCLRTQTFYIQHDCFDILDMARHMIPKQDIKNHKLATVTEFLLPNHQAQYHNSLEDVKATGLCCELLTNMYEKIKIPENMGVKIFVDWAYFWNNPHSLSQRHIKVCINKHDSGVYWNCAKGCWTCKNTADAKKIFNTIDLADMEQQVLFLYGKKYGPSKTMDDLAREWGRAYSAEQRQKKLESKMVTEAPPQENDFELW